MLTHRLIITPMRFNYCKIQDKTFFDLVWMDECEPDLDWEVELCRQRTFAVSPQVLVNKERKCHSLRVKAQLTFCRTY